MIDNKWKPKKVINRVNRNLRHIGILAYFPPHEGGGAQLAQSLSDCLEKNNILVHKMRRALLPKRRSWSFISTMIGKGFLQQLKILIMLLSSIKKCKTYHIISFSFFGFIPSIIATIICRITGRNLVLAFHSGNGDEFLNKWGPIIKKFFQRADLLIVASSFLNDVFQSHGLKTLKIRDVYPQTRFTFKERNIFEPKFLMTRALEEIYRHECALRAFSKVKEQLSNASLTIVGTGSLEPKLKKLVNELGIDDVTFAGHVEHEEMQNYYDRSDIYLNPTYPDNISPSVLEALACGLPIVSAEYPGVKEIIENRVSGLFFEKGNPDAMAECMIELTKDNNLATRLATNARKNWELHSCKLIVPIYRKLYGNNCYELNSG